MNTFCFILGPHRNLTTLLASVCTLHPNIHGLNHGYKIFEEPKYNFINDYSDEKFNSFLLKANSLLDKNKFIKRAGGSMIGSHAFLRSEFLRNTYSKISKQDIQSIIWKHPENYYLLRDQIDEFITKNDSFRFLLPIRNPMDCAFSNQIGFKEFFGGKNVTQLDVLKQLFQMYTWFIECNKTYPDKFLYFFENEMTEDTMNRLLSFLMIDTNTDQSKQWYKQVNTAWKIINKKQHTKHFIKQYKNCVEELKDASLQERFLSLI